MGAPEGGGRVAPLWSPLPADTDSAAHVQRLGMTPLSAMLETQLKAYSKLRAGGEGGQLAVPHHRKVSKVKEKEMVVFY